MSIFKGPMPGLWYSGSVFELPVAWVNQIFFFEKRIDRELHDHDADGYRYEGKLWYLDVGEQKFGTIPIAFRANTNRNQITVEKTRICYARVPDMTEQGIDYCWTESYDLEIFDFWNACESKC